MRIRLAAGTLMVCGAAMLGGCGVSEQDLEDAYRAGHRAGIIWCKRDEEPGLPDLQAELLAEWQRGWDESASIQCAGKFRRALE